MLRYSVLILVLFLAGLLTGLPLARADVAVIVHRDSPLQASTREEISALYLGRSRQLANGQLAEVFEHPREADLRRRFFFSLNGMELRQLNSYWARLQFSGQVLPPPAVADSRHMLLAVRSSRSAIGYVDAGEVDGSVRVLLLLKEAPK